MILNIQNQCQIIVQLGNNFSGMPIDWYNPKNGPFKVQVVSKGGARSKNRKFKGKKNK